MPLDGTSIIHAPKQLPVASAGLGSGASNRTVAPVGPRPVPARLWSRRPGNLSSALAVLSRARVLLGVERHWCQGSLVEGWRDIPAQRSTVVMRRYCALGAIMQAGCELGLGCEGASAALRGRICRPIEDW